MLSNAYFLAKFRFDTAENEPAKNLQKFCKNLLTLLTRRGLGEVEPVAEEARGERPLSPQQPEVLRVWTRRVVAKFWQIFGRMSLVFGRIGADLCK